ncbi:hypothetical protein [Nocardia heshunensis]
MRVVNANRTGIEDAEKRVIEALRAWRVPGIAVSGIQIPEAAAPPSQAHLLVVLPYSAVLIVAYLVPRRAGGAFRCPAQGDWSLSNQEDGGRYVIEFENPLPAIRTVLDGLSDATQRTTGTTAPVNGRVIVVPWPKFPVFLEKVGFSTAGQLDVLLFDSGLSELRGWADSHEQDERVWTVEKVASLLGGYGFTADSRDPNRRVTPQELRRVGFDPETQIIDPPRKRNRQLRLAAVVAAVWLGVAGVVGLALTPDRSTGTGPVTVTTSVPGVTTSPGAPK